MSTAEPLTTTTATSVPVASLRNAPHKLVGRLGPWQLMRQIATSELSRVYLARPEESQGNQAASYAIKVLRQKWWQNRLAVEMFRREAWVGNRVSHPSLLPILSSSVQQPPFFLVSPRLSGATLLELLSHHATLSVSMALWIARQISEGLKELHDRLEVLHADIKPANIFVSEAGHATLLDFGTAHRTGELNAWFDKPVVGTLNYMAPEILTSSIAATIRSDMYSLGVVLYEMLTGQLPFVSDDAGELAKLHREAKPPCIRQCRPDVPKRVASLVHTLLAKEALRRPASYDELIERLVRLEIASFEDR